MLFDIINLSLWSPAEYFKLMSFKTINITMSKGINGSNYKIRAKKKLFYGEHKIESFFGGIGYCFESLKIYS